MFIQPLGVAFVQNQNDMMFRSFCFFILLLLSFHKADGQYGSSFSFSDDGKRGAFHFGSELIIFSLPHFEILYRWPLILTFTEELDPKNYRHPENYHEFVPAIELSGNGEKVLFLHRGRFYDMAVSSKQLIRTFSKDTVAVQSMFGFKTDYTGSNIITTHIGQDRVSGTDGCSPGYRIPVYIRRDIGKQLLHEKEGCYFADISDMDRDGNVVFHDQNGIWYFQRAEDRIEKIIDGHYRLLHNGFCNEGKTVFINGRVPVTEELIVQREERINRAIFAQLQPEVSLKQFNAMSEAGRLETWPDYKKKMEWLRFCNPDSVWTLMVVHKTESGWTKPEQVVPAHPFPVAWSSAISPDGNSVVWVELERGDDGNAIISKRLQMSCKGVDGKWSAPRVIMNVEEHNLEVFVFNDHMFFVHAGRKYLYSGWNKGKSTLTEIFIP